MALARLSRVAVATAALALSACGPTPVQTPKSPPSGAASLPAGGAGPGAPNPLSGERILADAVHLCSPELAGRGSYQEGGVKAADWVADAFNEIGLEVVRQSVGNGAVNVIGIKRGSSSKAVVVSAHYDHLGRGDSGEVYLGADDNASGAAVMLAIARDLAPVATEHSVLFAAFGAEEAGLVGSGYYVRHPLVPLADTVAVVNFDMVGRNFFESGADTPNTAAIVGVDALTGTRAVALTAAKERGLTLIEAPAKLLELFRLENRTDDWWFRRRGVAAIHFSTGLHDDYHEVTDTPDKLIPSQLEKIAQVAAALVRFLAAAP